MNNYYWNRDCFKVNVPVNVDEVCATANEMIEDFANDRGEMAACEYSMQLWEVFCLVDRVGGCVAVWHT